jgi:hypothetical protein
MAGRMKWKTYRADSNVDYAVFRDESNSLATVGSAGAVLLAPVVLGSVGIPRNVTPRYVNTYLPGSNPLQKKKFVIGTNVAFTAITSGSTINEGGTTPLVWTVTSKVGEKVRIPVA